MESEETLDLDAREVVGVVNALWPHIAARDPPLQLVILTQLVDLWIVQTFPQRLWKEFGERFADQVIKTCPDTAADLIAAGKVLPTKMPR